MRIWDIRTNREVTRAVAVAELRRQGVARAEMAVSKLQIGQRIEQFMAVADAPPTIQDIMAITSASYAAVYRWTTGRSKFPLDAFLRVIVAREADVPSAVAWAEMWLGVTMGDGHGPAGPPTGQHDPGSSDTMQ